MLITINFEFLFRHFYQAIVMIYFSFKELYLKFVKNLI